MISKKSYSVLILLAITSIALVACNRSKKVEEPAVDSSELVWEDETESEIEFEPESEIVEEEPAPAPAPAPRPAVKKAPAEEVLYISGHGTNGRVWGHIKMKGNKGTGSVTDEHENALSVTCTRQGEELICYDQNSRQYIFRL